MSDDDFDQRLNRVTKAAEALQLIDNAELQAEAFRYLIGSGARVSEKHADQTPSGTPAGSGAAEPQATDSGNRNGAPGTGKKSAQRKGKPSSVSPDKSIDLSPAGKQSFLEFAAEKRPAGHIERYTVCVYWIVEIAGLPSASVAQIVTCYHAASWPLPSDVRNTASQAGKKEFDNTDGLDKIRLSNLGRDLVLSLPKAEKK
jgi:hypothetical protein